MTDSLMPAMPEILRPEGRASLLILCDHASNRIPPDLGDLGVPRTALNSHIAIDIGAAETARRLSDRLDAPAVLATVSRLVVDLNRNPKSLSKTSHGGRVGADMGRMSGGAAKAGMDCPRRAAPTQQAAHIRPTACGRGAFRCRRRRASLPGAYGPACVGSPGRQRKSSSSRPHGNSWTDSKTQDPIPTQSDGVAISGNRGLSDAQRRARLDAYFHPYHAACESRLDAMLARGLRPIVIGLHSFTPVMNGERRPWEIGFLYDRDPRLFEAMRPMLEGRWGFTVGDNEPYSGDELYYTMKRHGEAHGLLQATIEIRQDLIAEPAGQDRWADILAECLEEVIDRAIE